MKIDAYLHAALVLKGAEKEITKENIVAVLKAAGASVDEAKAQVLAEAIKGVNFEELLKNVTVASSAPAAQAAPASSAGQAGEAKKEEKKEDPAKQEAAAAEGLAALFG
ncbi:MAG: 50S ribosomal protein P1 [Candidatus Micrarchaeota archaeon]|nr:50S ribosomal protein P1 [Candidatus Micrarchaeota archaeon]